MVEVPLIDEPGARVQLPIVEVTINGKGPYRFGIETGARFIGVTCEFAVTLGLPRRGGPDEFPQFFADSINIGAASFQGVAIGTLPAAARGVDGILGLPLYEDLLLTIDYPGKKLRFERGALPAANGRDVLTLVRADDFWAMPVSIAGRGFSAVLDTRSSGTFSVTPIVADSILFDGPLSVIGRAAEPRSR